MIFKITVEKDKSSMRLELVCPVNWASTRTCRAPTSQLPWHFAGTVLHVMATEQRRVVEQSMKQNVKVRQQTSIIS